jgi:hypothetical protein
MLQAGFFIPIFDVAFARPIVRTSVPPMVLVKAPGDMLDQDDLA